MDLALSKHSVSTISPSDSISCREEPVIVPRRREYPPAPLVTKYGAPAVRPKEYPIEVLWNFEDCKYDEDACPSDSNPSRPSMVTAIRHRDGTMITQAEWKNIKATAHHCKQTYFWTYFFDEWLGVLQEMERQQPLLALCSGHWKAEHVLGLVLLSHSQTIQDATSTPSGRMRRKEVPKTGRARRQNNRELEGQPVSHTQLPALTLLAPSPDVTKRASYNISVEVDPSIDSLLAILTHEFSSIECGPELLEAMKLNSTFGSGSPSPATIAFIERIERADPSVPYLQEDDLGASWGHYQFTADSMTCGTTLTSWASIGHSDTALRLIAAAVKTCKIARHICCLDGIHVESYLSDAYLVNVLETIWALWKEAGGPVLKGKDVARSPASGPPHSRSHDHTEISISKPSCPNHFHETCTSLPEDENSKIDRPNTGNDAMLSYIRTLTVDEIYDWIKEHDLVVPRRRAKKDEWIAVITSADLVNRP
ncbi:hypothetical protein B0H21DRAFT_812705 [Amylocystis lapponica]|nr:hypothetical protein B0H21DRAFT_812705 [Amylocystis lapponica]